MKCIVGGAASARQLVNPGRGSQYQILRRPDRIAGGAAVVLPACGGGARPLYKLGTQVRFTTRATHAPNTVADGAVAAVPTCGDGGGSLC